MFWRSDVDAGDAEKLSDRVDFTEGYSGLGHAPRAGIHAEKGCTGTIGTHGQVLREAVPRVTQRVVDVRDRRQECESIRLNGELVVKFENV